MSYDRVGELRGQVRVPELRRSWVVAKARSTHGRFGRLPGSGQYRGSWMESARARPVCPRKRVEGFRQMNRIIGESRRRLSQWVLTGHLTCRVCVGRSKTWVPIFPNLCATKSLGHGKKWQSSSTDQGVPKTAKRCGSTGRKSPDQRGDRDAFGTRRQEHATQRHAVAGPKPVAASARPVPSRKRPLGGNLKMPNQTDVEEALGAIGYRDHSLTADTASSDRLAPERPST